MKTLGRGGENRSRNPIRGGLEVRQNPPRKSEGVWAAGRPPVSIGHRITFHSSEPKTTQGVAAPVVVDLLQLLVARRCPRVASLIAASTSFTEAPGLCNTMKSQNLGKKCLKQLRIKQPANLECLLHSTMAFARRCLETELNCMLNIFS